MVPVLDLHVETFTRDGVAILRGIRWQISPGEHWVVLGANGAGKSSLLSMVAGYEWPSRGRVAVLGETYGECDMRALKERIGWVSSALFSWLPGRQSARQVVATGIHATIGNWHELSAEDLIRADDALRRIGAFAFRNKRYGVLSQGEKQRVMIARSRHKAGSPDPRRTLRRPRPRRSRAPDRRCRSPVRNGRRPHRDLG